MRQDNDKTASIVLLIILIGALFSTVLYFKAETGRVEISQIDASVAFVQGGTELLVKPQLENTKKSDSGSISLGIEVEEPRSNQILGQGNTSLGYVKAKSTQTANIYIPMEGEVSGLYRIKITLFENGGILPFNFLVFSLNATNRRDATYYFNPTGNILSIILSLLVIRMVKKVRR